jgi:hypothetical protein
MADTKQHPVRQGRTVTFQFDYDADEMLREMSTPRSRGAFLAGLVRAEYERQRERRERRLKRQSARERESVKH